jgi:hypothetical protein
MSPVVKVCGCRPHDGGAARTGAGVRKPPMEETAGRDASGGVGYRELNTTRDFDFVAGGFSKNLGLEYVHFSRKVVAS